MSMSKYLKILLDVLLCNHTPCTNGNSYIARSKWNDQLQFVNRLGRQPDRYAPEKSQHPKNMDTQVGIADLLRLGKK